MITSSARDVRQVAGRSRSGASPRGRLLAKQLAVGVVIILIWWAAAHFRWLPPEILPTPLVVAIQFFQLAGTEVFWVAFFQTLGAAMAGLGLAIVIGIPIGLLLGLAPAVERTTRFLLDFGRSFPVIALLPVTVLILGATSQMEITVIVIGVVWPILLQAIYGSRRIDPVVRDTTRSYRINLWLRFAKVLLPGAAPFIATGIRVSASVAILLAVGVEILGRIPGIGFNLSQAQSDGRPDIALAYLVYSGLLGLAINTILERLEVWALVWNARADAAAT